MKRLFRKGSVLALLLIFLPAVAGAVPFDFYNTDGAIVATVDVEKSGPAGGLFTYTYTVANVNFSPISFLTMFVWDPFLAYGYSTGGDKDVLNMVINPLPVPNPMNPAGPAIVAGILTVEFDDIGPGEVSNPFNLQSVLDEGLVSAVLKDTNEETSALVMTAVSAPGNHGADDPVPEPTTLLLLGSGLLGLAGYRIRNLKTKK